MAAIEEHEGIFDLLNFSENDQKKFEPILKYLKNLDLEDLKSFTVDDYYEAVLREDKLLMSRFGKRVENFFKQRNLFNPSRVLRVKAVGWKYAAFASKEEFHPRSSKSIWSLLSAKAMP
jgi:hypothetical protein